MGRRGKCKCFGPKIETYGLDFEKPRPYELRSAQKNVASLRGPRGDRQLSACSRRPSSGLGLLGLLVEEDPGGLGVLPHEGDERVALLDRHLDREVLDLDVAGRVAVEALGLREEPRHVPPRSGSPRSTGP